MQKSLTIIQIMTISILLVSAVQANDWPMFQHDPSHTGHTIEVVPDNLELIWTYDIGLAPSSPVVANGNVFVSSTEKIYCLDANKGDLIWEHEIESLYYSTPAIAYGKVFVGSMDTKIYCLDEDTGDLIWSYKTGDMVKSSPTVANDKVFVGSNDGKIYCLGEENGDLIWSYKTGDRVIASPAVAYGKVFVGSMNGIIYCLDETEGDLIWNYNTGDDWVQESPAVRYEKVFVASEDGKIYCLGEANGNLIWSYKSPTEGNLIICTPAIADKKVFVSTKDGNVIYLCVDSGKEVGSWGIGLCSYCSPVIANEKLFIGLQEGMIWCLNMSNTDWNADMIWTYTTDGSVSNPPAIADGKVFSRWGGEIHCFGKPIEPIPTPMPTPTPILAPTLKTPASSSISTPTPVPTLIDSDKDGVPDQYDYAPYDPNVQSRRDIKTPAFEAIFGIVGVLIAARLLRRK